MSRVTVIAWQHTAVAALGAVAAGIAVMAGTSALATVTGYGAFGVLVVLSCCLCMRKESKERKRHEEVSPLRP